VVSVKTPNCFTATTTRQRLTPARVSLSLSLRLLPSAAFRTRGHMQTCVRVRPLPPSRYKHRTRASLGAAIPLASSSVAPSLSLSRSHGVPPPPHFRATRSVLRSPQLPAFSLLSSFSRTHTCPLSLPPSRPRFHSFLPAPVIPLSSHSRHPIPDTRYLIMLNASGFCGRIMRPRCPHTLFRSLRTAFPLSLSFVVPRRKDLPLRLGMMHETR